MFNKNNTINRNCAAIDIGTNSIKILEAESDQGQHTLSKIYIKSIPSKSEGSNINEVLKKAVKEADLKTKDVFISLSGPNTIVRFIQMPEMNTKDLKNSLMFEADKYIPFGIDEVNIDSYVFEGSKDEQGQIRVLLAAIKKSMVDQQLELYGSLGLNVLLIDINAFSVFNAFLASGAETPKESSIAILNVGHRYTNVIVAKGKAPYFTRDIQIGGEAISSLVASQFDMEQSDVFNPELDMNNYSDEKKSFIKSAFSKLCDEIRLSFGYYENQFGGSIEKVYVTGGLAAVPGVVSILEEYIGIKSVIWDPLSSFRLSNDVSKEDLEKIKYSFAVSAGLIVRDDVR